MDIPQLTNSNRERRPPKCCDGVVERAGARGGCALLREPLPVSLGEDGCICGPARWKRWAGGRNYRVAYMSAHTAGQRAAIMADLAVAPLPKSFLGNDMVELGPRDGMPEIGNYNLAMVMTPDASAPVNAVADHIRATFEVFRQTGRF